MRHDGRTPAHRCAEDGGLQTTSKKSTRLRSATIQNTRTVPRHRSGTAPERKCQTLQVCGQQGRRRGKRDHRQGSGRHGTPPHYRKVQQPLGIKSSPSEEKGRSTPVLRRPETPERTTTRPRQSLAPLRRCYRTTRPSNGQAVRSCTLPHARPDSWVLGTERETRA